MSNQLKTKVAVVGLFLFVYSLVVYGLLDHKYRLKSLEFLKQWQTAESDYLEYQDPKSEVTINLIDKYEDVAFSSDFFLGMRAYDQLKFVGQFGDITAVWQYIGAFKSDWTIHRTGLLEYLVLWRHPKDKDVIFAFHFLDDLAHTFLYALLVIFFFFVLIFTLILEVYDRKRQDAVMDAMHRTVKSLAHDIRAPFAKLKRLFLYIDRNKLSAAAPDSTVMIKDIDASFNYIEGIIADILRVDNKDAPVSTIHLKKMLQDIVDLYPNQSNPSVVINLDDSLHIQSDKDRLWRILLNLIDNARAHAKSQVTIASTYRHGKRNIQVSNDGDVIGDDVMRTLFQPFQSFRKGGVGLGLYIAQQSAQKIGGSIRCRIIDGQTSFLVAIPDRPSAQPQSNAKIEKLDLAALGLNTSDFVSIIEDEAIYSDQLQSTLNAMGLRSVVFTNTDDALMALEKDPKPCLIIADQYGPGFDSVKDRFPESCRDFGYLGPVVLYSNAVQDGKAYEGFSDAINKHHLISTKDLERWLKKQN